MTLKERLESSRVPKQAIAVLSGVTPAVLSLFLRDPALVSEGNAVKIAKTIEDACRLDDFARTNFARGICIDWKDAAAIRDIIADARVELAWRGILAGKEQNAILA
jgi:hypothetical protein